MKKVFLFALICGLFIGCSDDDEFVPKTFTKAEITGQWTVTAQNLKSDYTKDWVAVNDMFVDFSETTTEFNGSFAPGESYTGKYTINGTNVICTDLSMIMLLDYMDEGRDVIAPEEPNTNPEPEPEPEPTIIGLDYYISDIYANTYDRPLNLKNEGIAADLIAQLADEELEGAELAALIAEIKGLLAETITDQIKVVEREFFAVENSTAGLFTLSATYSDGSIVKKGLRVKKVVE